MYHYKTCEDARSGPSGRSQQSPRRRDGLHISLSLSIYIYIYTYMYAYIYIYIYMYACNVYIYIYIYIHIHVYAYVCMCVYIYIYIYHTHVYISAYLSIYLSTYLRPAEPPKAGRPAVRRGHGRPIIILLRPMIILLYNHSLRYISFLLSYS